ncbi:DUF433 domain-containing protein [Hahella ganghwensis]|uniref:DUF433 domain-containing protein n=1 Tax=Hahella ganghwensis TaxID=286420 RepID=UPI00035D84EC|nr:DUF433 domain-containing protein [Hahella ganghwensis]
MGKHYEPLDDRDREDIEQGNAQAEELLRELESPSGAQRLGDEAYELAMRELKNGLAKHIESRPEVMVGKPCIKRTRIPVQTIQEMRESGMTYAEIISDFPSLTEAKIDAALAYPTFNRSKSS